jgi:hypothetical protein
MVIVTYLSRSVYRNTSTRGVSHEPDAQGPPDVADRSRHLKANTGHHLTGSDTTASVSLSDIAAGRRSKLAGGTSRNISAYVHRRHSYLVRLTGIHTLRVTVGAGAWRTADPRERVRK